MRPACTSWACIFLVLEIRNPIEKWAAGGDEIGRAFVRARSDIEWRLSDLIFSRDYLFNAFEEHPKCHQSPAIS